MKKIHTLFLALPLVFALGACDNKKSSEPILSNSKDGIKDAVDARPNEKTRDKVEDAGDSVKKAAGDAKDAVKGDK